MLLALENVVNRAFLVLIFLGEKLVGANFYAFCNYGMEWTTLQCKECFKLIFFRGKNGDNF